MTIKTKQARGTTVRLFYDTEFIEAGPDEPVRLISIAMIREDGSVYYAVVRDVGVIGRAWGHPWLRENVVPSLPVKDDPYGFSGGWNWDRSHPDFGNVKDRKDIVGEISDFILRYPDPELWADYCAYDHVALCQLFGRMIDLPEGVPMWTNDLRQVVKRAGNPDLPSLPGGTAHDALDDAREVRMRFQWLAENFPSAV